MNTGTRLIEDRKARAMVLRELRKVLAALKEQADRYRSAFGEGPADTPVASWGEVPTAPPEQAILEAVAAFRAGAVISTPGGATVEYLGPTPVLLQLVHRLVDVLGLSDLEREFFTAGAAREVPGAWDGLAAYADWLEDRGNDAGAMHVRKLTPAPGDVLVFTAPAGEYPQDGSFDAARRLKETLAARGVDVSWVLLPHDGRLDRLSEAQMAELGWARAPAPPAEGGAA
jgi:hypothetical protein